MGTNLRALVAKAYRVRQGRTFSSSSSSSASNPNPIDNEGKISIYEWLLSRGSVMLLGFGAASYFSGDLVSKFEEKAKVHNKDAVEFLEKRGKLPPGSVESLSKS